MDSRELIRTTSGSLVRSSKSRFGLRISLLFLCNVLILCSFYGQAAGVYETTHSGNWSTPATWEDGVLPPTSGNGITHQINAGHAVTYTGMLTYGNSCVLNVFGSLVINGDVIANNTLIINVTGSLTINGNLESKNGGSISISGTVGVSGDVVAGNSGTIDLQTGSLNIGGSLSGGSGCEITGSGTVNIEGANDFDDTPASGVTVNSNLPVSMVLMEARCQKDAVAIHWQTSSELNNAFFSIERSQDAQSWSLVADVPGAINSNSLLDYYFMDEDPPLGVMYYRIRQTDVDGATETFAPVEVFCNADKFEVRSYPNPVCDYLNLEMPGANLAVVSVKIVDMLGKTQQAITFTWDSPLSARIDLNKLPSGCYFLVIRYGDELTVKKITKN